MSLNPKEDPSAASFDITLASEWMGYKERIQQYESELKQASVVKVVVGCDDSRVDVPVGLQDNGDFYILLPVIGGGVPSRAALDALLSYLKETRGSLSNIEIYASQHGGHEEVSAVTSGKPAPKHTCGARAVKGMLSTTIIDTYLNVSRAEVPEALDEELGLPAMLVHSAVHLEADIVANAHKTVVGIEMILQELDCSDVPVHPALYDHNRKTLTTLDELGSVMNVVEIPGLEAYDEDFQDPAMTVGRLGPKLAGIADGVLAPTIVGTGDNNDFNGYAATTEDLRVMLSEMSYAVSHHAEHVDHPEDHAGDHNFVHLSHATIYVQDDEYGKILDDYTKTDFYKKYYAKIFASTGGLHVQNVETGKVTHYHS